MILWRSPVHFANGYGGFALSALKALERAGVPWRGRVIRYFAQEGVPKEWMAGRLGLEKSAYRDARRAVDAAAPRLGPEDIVLTYYMPEYCSGIGDRGSGIGNSQSADIGDRGSGSEIGSRTPYLAARIPLRVCYTMFETSRPPERWVEILNERVDLTLVPCEQNVVAFRAAGVENVALLPHGVDVAEFYPAAGFGVPNPESRTPNPERRFFFGCAGTLTGRKGVDLVVDAFVNAFSVEDRKRDVGLVIKTRSGQAPFRAHEHAGVTLIDATWDVARMRKFYQRLNVYVSASRGEGFGLTPVQAMFCGTPAIATGWGGLSDTVTPDVGWPLKFRMVRCNSYEPELGDVGYWAEPDAVHLCEQMRWCFEHRDACEEMGVQAADLSRRRWNMDLFPGRLLEALKSRQGDKETGRQGEEEWFGVRM